MGPDAGEPRRHPGAGLAMSAVYRLEITLRDVEPRVWRRLEVPATVTLQRLHAIIQTAMGWEDRHLFEFRAGGHAYGVPDEETPDLRDARRVKLKDVAREGGHLEYTYDFGDDWHHDIAVERVLDDEDPATHYPICI